MKKLDSTLRNMVFSLFFICSIMAGALALVYSATKTPIEDAEKNKINNAIAQVVPSFDNDPGKEMYKVAVEDGDSLVFYPATKDGQLVGTAVSTYTKKAFSGSFTVMVGFLPDGSIYNSIALAHKETPGLGSKMSDAKFHDQFNGKNPADFKLVVKKDGGDVDAITAATISSRAYCDALSKAYHAFSNNNTDSYSGATKGGTK